jgi:hypothetical protein
MPAVTMVAVATLRKVRIVVIAPTSSFLELRKYSSAVASKLNCQKCADRRGEDIPGKEGENACGDSVAVERGEQSADCRRG